MTSDIQLRAESIVRQVSELDPNFPWCKEFMLERWRGLDIIYRRFKHLLKSIPSSVVYNIRVITLNDRDQVKSLGYNKEIIIPLNDLTSDVSQIVTSIAREIETRSYSINGYLHVPVITSFGDNIQGAIYLAHPRANLENTTRVMLSVDSDRSPVNYAYITNTCTNGRLQWLYPHLFKDDVSDVSIVREILLNDPNYDPQELLSWLELRRQVYEKVVSSDMFNLAMSGMIKGVLLSYNCVMLVTGSDQYKIDEVTKYVRSLCENVKDIQLNQSMVSVQLMANVEDNTEALKVMNRLMREFISVRMVSKYYLPEVY